MRHNPRPRTRTGTRTTAPARPTGKANLLADTPITGQIFSAGRFGCGSGRCGGPAKIIGRYPGRRIPQLATIRTPRRDTPQTRFIPERSHDDLAAFLEARGDALLQTAVLLAAGREAGEDLLQEALVAPIQKPTSNISIMSTPPSPQAAWTTARG